MYRKKLKPFVLPLIYSVSVFTFITSIFFLGRALNFSSLKEKDKDFDYVIKDVINNEIPVVGSEKAIVRPYTDSDIKIVKHFYDYQADSSKQENSILYYENIYMQNSGVDYSGPANFDVVAIMDGTIININEDNLLGKVIDVRHTNDFISIYQCLSEININKGDTVSQGQLIGKSGTCNIATDLKDHLHLEILYKGRVVDPETFYDKTIKDL